MKQEDCRVRTYWYYKETGQDGDDENGSILADDFVLYNLRHTYCTDLQKAGIPIDIAKYLMGHEDITTTSNIYTDSAKHTALIASALFKNKREEMEKEKENSNKKAKIRSTKVATN